MINWMNNPLRIPDSNPSPDEFSAEEKARLTTPELRPQLVERHLSTCFEIGARFRWTFDISQGYEIGHILTISYHTQMLHGAGIFTYIYPKNHPHVGKYTIHGASGIW